MAPRPGLAHQRDRAAGAIELARDVDRDRAVPVGGLDLLHPRGGAGDPCVVNQDVDAAHGFRCDFEQPVDLSRVPNVGLDRTDPSAPHVFDQAGLDVAGEDRCAVGRQRLRNDAPDARAAGGHDRAAPLTRYLHDPLPLPKRAQE